MWHRREFFVRMFSLQYWCEGFVNTDRLILCKFFGLQNPPLSRAQINLSASCNFPFSTRFENVQWLCSLVFIPWDFPKYPIATLNVPFTRSTNAPTIIEVKSKKYVCANMFGSVNALGVLQYNWMKNYHPLRVTLQSSYTIEIHRNSSENLLLTFPDGTLQRWVGIHTSSFHLSYHLPSSVIPPYIWFPIFWCNQY